MSRIPKTCTALQATMFEFIEQTNKVATTVQILNEWVGAGSGPVFRVSWHTAPAWDRYVDG
jgi:hypothetical protein